MAATNARLSNLNPQFCNTVELFLLLILYYLLLLDDNWEWPWTRWAKQQLEPEGGDDARGGAGGGILTGLWPEAALGGAHTRTAAAPPRPPPMGGAALPWPAISQSAAAEATARWPQAARRWLRGSAPSITRAPLWGAWLLAGGGLGTGGASILGGALGGGRLGLGLPRAASPESCAEAAAGAGVGSGSGADVGAGVSGSGPVQNRKG